jgi:hypothetical protein
MITDFTIMETESEMERAVNIIGDSKITRAFEHISNYYDKLAPVLKTLGMDEEDEYRLVKYRNGLFRQDNLLRKESSKLYSYTRNYTILSTNENGLFENSDGVIIPAFKSTTQTIYTVDSEFYICGQRALISNSIHDAIATLTENRIDSDDVRVLKSRGSSVDFVLITDGTILITGNVRYIRKNIIEDAIVKTFAKLDEFEQPYARGFLIDPATKRQLQIFMKAIRDPGIVSVTNQIFTTEFITGNSKLFKTDPRLVNSGYHLLPSLKITVLEDGSVSTKPIIVEPKTAIGGSLYIAGRRNHQTLFIVEEGTVLFFDPAYDESLRSDPVIMKMYEQLALIFPGMEFINMFMTCELERPLQSDKTDVYCLSWSYYLAIVAILDENLLDAFSELDKLQLRITIIRFILAITGIELFETLHGVMTSAK